MLYDIGWLLASLCSLHTSGSLEFSELQWNATQWAQESVCRGGICRNDFLIRHSALSLWLLSTCGSQKTTSMSSPAALWDVGIELGSSGLYANTFSHWAISLAPPALPTGRWRLRMAVSKWSDSTPSPHLSTRLRKAPRVVRKARKIYRSVQNSAVSHTVVWGKVMHLLCGSFVPEEQKLSKLHNLFYYNVLFEFYVVKIKRFSQVQWA